MMPYSRINIGDVFDSPMRWTGSWITYTVVDKADGMIEVRSSYQHPSLSETMWKKPTDRIFTQRLWDATKDNPETTPAPTPKEPTP